MLLRNRDRDPLAVPAEKVTKDELVGNPATVQIIFDSLGEVSVPAEREMVEIVHTLKVGAREKTRQKEKVASIGKTLLLARTQRPLQHQGMKNEAVTAKPSVRCETGSAKTSEWLRSYVEIALDIYEEICRDPARLALLREVLTACDNLSTMEETLTPADSWQPS